MTKDSVTLFISFLFITTFSYPLFAKENEDVSNAPSSLTDEISFIDKTYHYLNNTFSFPAIWFDEFFVDPRSNEDVHSKTMVKWYNDIYWYEESTINYQSKLSARVYLPKVSHKLKLIFESDDEDPFPNSASEEQNKASNQLGLRYDISEKERSSFNIKITIRPSIEARYRYRYPVTATTSFNFVQKLYQKKKVTGTSSQLDFNYSLTPERLLRLNNWLKWETDINAFKNGSNLTLYQYISKKNAINYSMGIRQTHAPYSYIDKSYISITYRQNILKKWFFYELKPEVDWLQTPDMARTKNAAITLRFEVLFTGV